MFKMKALRKSKILILLALIITVMGIVIGARVLTNSTENALMVENSSVKRGEAYKELGYDDLVTDTSDVLFGAFFEDQNSQVIYDGKAVEIGKEEALSFYLDVYDGGRLENARITITNDNFDLTTNLVKSSAIKENAVGVNVGEIKFNTIEGPFQTEFTGNISFPETNNISKYSSSNNKIRFTGDYYYEDEPVVHIDKEISITVDWFGTTVSELNKSYDNQYYNLDESINGQTFDAVFYIYANETADQLILNKNKIEGTLPKISSFLPSKLKVDDKNATCVLNADGTFTIEKNAKLNGTTVTNIVPRENIYKVTAKYPIEAISGKEDETIILNIPIKSTYEGFNNSNEGYDNPYVSESETAISAIYKAEDAQNEGNISVSVGNDFYDYSLASTRKVVSKDGVYNVYNKIKDGNDEDRYIVRWQLASGEDLDGKVIVVEQDASDKLVKENGTESDLSGKVTFKGIYFTNANSILDSNGYIEIYNKDNNRLLKKFTMDEINSFNSEENAYIYDIPTSNITVRTSEVNGEGFLEIYNIKNIDDKAVANAYQEDEFDSFNKIKSSVKGYISDSMVLQAFDTDVATANYEAAYSKAKLSLSDNAVSPEEEKEITATISTQVDNYIEKGWRNGSFILKLPQEVTSARINTISVNNPNVTIKSANSYKASGINYVKVITENQGEESFEIELKLALKADAYAADGDKNAELYYSNEICPNYYIGYKAIDIYDVNDNTNTEEMVGKETNVISIRSEKSISGLISANNFDEQGTIAVAPEVAIIDKSKSEAKVDISITNTSNKDVTELKVIGRLPFIGNKDLKTGEDLNSDYKADLKGPITITGISGAKIYYSENENADTDLTSAENGWKDTVLDATKIKSYLIDLGAKKLESNQVLTVSYEVRTTASSGQRAYITNKAEYFVNTNDGKVREEYFLSNLPLEISQDQSMEVSVVEAGTNRAISNVSLNILNVEENESTLVKTGSNGKTNAKLTLNKTYKVKEAKIDEHHIIDANEISFKIVESSGVLTVTEYIGPENLRPTIENGTLKVKFVNEIKYDLVLNKLSYGGAPAEDVRFSITGNGTSQEFISNQDGLVEIKGLIPGVEYTLSEIGSKGYYLKDNVIFKLVRNESNAYVFQVVGGAFDSTPVVTNNDYVVVNVELVNTAIKTFDLELINKVVETNDNLPGTSFILYEGENQVSFDSNENGVLNKTSLHVYNGEMSDDVGNYVIKMNNQVDGYALDENNIVLKVSEVNGNLNVDEVQGKHVKAVNVTGRKVSIIFESIPYYTISKIDDVTEEPVRGAKYIILDNTGNTANDINGKPLFDLQTNENGQIVVALETGVYSLVETESPEGYKLNTEYLRFGIRQEDGDRYEGALKDVKLENSVGSPTAIENLSSGGVITVQNNGKVSKLNNNNVVEWTNQERNYYYTDVEVTTNYIYAVGNDAELVCYDLSGNLVWEQLDSRYFYILNAVKASPNGEIYTLGDNGAIIKYDIFGNVEWSNNGKASNNYIDGIIVSDGIIAISSNGNVVKYGQDGTEVWEKTDIGHTINGCAEIANSGIVLAGESGKITKIDYNGNKQWSQSLNFTDFIDVEVSGNKIYAITANGTVAEILNNGVLSGSHSYNGYTFKKLTSLNGELYIVATFAENGSTVDTIMKIDSAYNVAWENQKRQHRYTTIADTGSRILAAYDNGYTLYDYNGNIISENNVPLYALDSIVVNGYVYIAGYNEGEGYITKIDATTGNVVSSITVGDLLLKIDIDGNNIYGLTTSGEILKYDLNGNIDRAIETDAKNAVKMDVFDGKILIVKNNGENYLYDMSSEGNEWQFTDTLNYTGAVVLNNKIYMVSIDGTFTIKNLDGTTSYQSNDFGYQYNNIVESSNGIIAVAADGILVKYDFDGNIMWTTGDFQGAYYDGVAHSNNIYFVTNSGELVIFEEKPSDNIATISDEFVVREEKEEYEIKTRVNGFGGTISGKFDDVYEYVKHGEDTTKELIVTADTGFFVSSIKINGEEKEFNEISGTVNLGKLVDVRENKFIEVEFKKDGEYLTIRKVDSADNNTYLPNATFHVAQEETRPELTDQDKQQIIGNITPYHNQYEEEQITYGNEVSGLIGYPVSNTAYYFSLGPNGEYFPNNSFMSSTTARTYFEIDLTDQTGNYALVLNAKISSEFNCDIGYAFVTESALAPTYTNEEGRIIYFSGVGDSVTTPRDFKVMLEGGKRYFLHLGYTKDRSTDTGEDSFKVLSMKLYENAVSTKVYNDYYFVQGEDGGYTSNNVNKPYTTANSYVPIDLRNYRGYYDVSFEGRVSSERNSDIAYATVTSYTEAPSHTQDEGRVMYESGTKPQSTYTTVLEGGKLYYLNFGYYKNGLIDDGSDNFTIYNVDVALSSSNFINETVQTNAKGEIYLKADFGRFNIEELEAPEGYTIDTPLTTYNYDVNSNNVVVISDTMQAKVIVHFKEKGTNQEVAPDLTMLGDIGTEYVTTPVLKIGDYELEKDQGNNYVIPTNASGTYTTSDIEVTYYYEKVQNQVIVHHYKDGTEERLVADKTYAYNNGESYDTEPITYPELDGNYVLASDKMPANKSGIYNGTTIEVTYYYKTKTSSGVLVHYYEENSTNNIIDDIIIDGAIGDEYKTEIPSDFPTNYEFVSKVGNDQGVMTANQIEVTYYFRNKAASIASNNITVTSSMSEIETIEEPTPYRISYKGDIKDYIGKANVQIVAHLEYIIDEATSDLAGGTYDNNAKTITWTETFAGIDTYKDGNDYSINIVKDINIVYADLSVSDRMMETSVNGTITLTEQNVTVSDEASLEQDIIVPGSVTIKYIDINTGEEIADKIIDNGVIGEPYDISYTKKDIPGYTLVEELPTYTGIYQLRNQAFTYKYARNVDVTVEYINKYTNESISSNDVIHLYVGQSYSVSHKDIAGYKYIESSNNESGVIEDNVTVKYYYAKQTKVTAKYYYEAGNRTIVDDVVINGYAGDPYQTTRKEIDGYTYLRVDGEENGVMTDANIVVTYVYSKNTKVNVYYKDKFTNENVDSPVVIDGYVGKDYQTQEHAVDGYTFVELNGNPEGQMTENTIDVTYLYCKNSNIIVKIIDKNTNEPIRDDNVLPGYQGQSYDVTEGEYIGYTYIESSGTKVGTYSNTDITVTHYYAKNSKVTAYYKNVITNENLVDPVEINGYEGKAYTTEQKTIDGYTFVRSEGVTSGNIGRNPSEIVYYYSENTRVVTKYIDMYTNESISADSSEEGYVGKEYHTTPKDIAGYTYQSVEGEENGTMIEGAITVKYFYAKNSQVIAKYIDKYSNEEIADRVVINSFEQKPYEVSVKTIDGYTYVETDGTESGNTPRDGVEIKYYYAKNSQVVAKYIDKYTNEEISETVTINSFEGNPYSVAKKDIDGYTYQDMTGTESGNTPRNGAEIKYFYAKNTTVKAKYVDKYTNEEIDSEVTINSFEGKPYETSKKNIAGYTYIETSGEASGATPRNGTTVTYYYAINSNVVVRYKDQEEQTEIKDATVINGYQGKEYQTTKENIPGFTYMRVEGTESGTMGRTQIEVVYFYSENTCAIARYIDKFTNEEVSPEVTIDGFIGKEYQTTRKDVTGYTFQEVQGEEHGFMVKGATIVTYYYAKNSQVVAKYIDKNTNEEISEKVVINSFETKPYETTMKDIDGYTYLEVDGQVSGNTPRNGTEIKYYYAKNAQVIARYVDKYANTPISENVVIDSYETKPYEVSKKDIDGYTYLETDGTERGATPRNGTSVTYYYAKNSNVVARYYDKYTGEEISEAVIIPSYEQKPYEVSKKDINGYTFLEKSGTESGNTPRDGAEVKYYYAINSNVIVKYKDTEDDTAVLKDDLVLPGYQGKDYKVQKEDIDGYTYLRVEGTEEGTYGRDDIIITYYYSENSRVFTRFIDVNTNEPISEDVIEEGYIGKEYQTTRKDISGYTYQYVDGQEHGNMIKGRITVTYYYAKNAQVITKFVDKNTNQELIENVIINSFETKPYETELKDIDGYTYLEVNGETSGNTPRDGVTVTYYYAKNAQVKAQYIDKNTNTSIADEEVVDSYESKPYETHVKDIQGYTFIEVDNPETGNTPRDGITVSYYYAQNTSVIVRYVDTDGKDLVPSELIEGYVGKGYTTIEKQIDGYTYIYNSNNTDGLMTEAAIQVVYTYGKNTHLYVKYIDEITGEELAEQKHHQGLSNVKYDLTNDKMDFEGFTLVESPTLTGEYGAEDRTVAFKYRKSTSVTVRYINKFTGEEISEKKVYNGVEKQEFDITNDVRDIDGFTLTEEPIMKNGEMPRDPIVLDYVYTKKVKVTAKYIDKVHPTETLREDIVYDGLQGEPYQTEYMDFIGYEFVEDTGNREGVREDTDIVVTFYYAKQTEVLVKYVDRKDDKVLETVVIPGYEGKEYETELKEFPDYVYIESTKNTSGNMIADEVIEVVYKYAHISEGVLERHIDIETNEMLYSELHQGIEGEPYKIDKREFEGFRCLETDRSNNNIYPENNEGTMTIEPIVVTYYYRRGAQIAIEFVDDFTGEKILEDEIITGEQNDEYNLEDTKQIEGYTLVKIPENIKGKMLVTKDEEGNVDITTHVTLKYLMNTEVIVKYIDVNDKTELTEPIRITGLEGEKYKTEYKEFYDYIFDYTINDEEGIMTEKTKEVIYYYAKRKEATIVYVDMNTGYDLLPSIKLVGKEGYTFDISDKWEYIEDYTLVKEPKSQGVFGKDDVMVFYYAKNTKIVIKYLEIDSYKPLSEHDKYYIDGYVGKDYSLDKREFPGYRCVKSTDNAKSKMTEDYQEIVFYYTEITNNEYDGSRTNTGTVGPREQTQVIVTEGNTQVITIPDGNKNVKVASNSSNTNIASTNLSNKKPIINDESTSAKPKSQTSTSNEKEDVYVETIGNVPDTQSNTNILYYIVGTLMILIGITIVKKAKKAIK